MLRTTKMRKPCERCSCPIGTVETRNGQDVVRCHQCQKYAGYNEPRSESGRIVRGKATRPRLTVRQRARVLSRDNGTCVICHRANVNLEVGHLLSVRDAKQQGLTEDEYMADENLAAMCDACNSGLGSASVPPRLMASLVRARLGTERLAS